MAKIDSGKTFNGKKVYYDILDIGYDIYLGSNLWITQHEPYIPDRDLTYEENAIAQIEDICHAQEENNTINEEVIE